ncbi:MAG TPA: hypothetical protein VKD72_33305 [Gemmataceae bacterium]|nr:hypothetical protein [Gemmataceae bacterium]
MLRLTFVGCAFLLVSAAVGAEPGQEPASNEVTAIFHDGTVIKRVVLPGSVELTTRYGKLTIPVKDIRRIEFGFRLSAEMAKQVEEGVQALGNKDFRQREAASKQLAALGARAWPAVQKAAQSKDMEVSRRAQAILQQIQQTVPADQLQIKPDDSIVTADCVLVGRVANEALKARTKTLGEMSFKLTDLRSLHGPTDAPGTSTVTALSPGTSASYPRVVTEMVPAPATPVAPPVGVAPQPAPALPQIN